MLFCRIRYFDISLDVVDLVLRKANPLNPLCGYFYLNFKVDSLIPKCIDKGDLIVIDREE